MESINLGEIIISKSVLRIDRLKTGFKRSDTLVNMLGVEDAICIAEAYAKEQKDELIKKIKEYKSNLEMITSTTPLEEGEIYAYNHILAMESKDER